MHCKAVFVRKYSTSLNDVGAVIPDLINHQRVSQTDADIAFLEIYGPSSLRGDVSVKPSSIFHPCLVAVPCRPSPALTLDLEPPLQLFFSISPTFLLIQPFAAVLPPSMLSFSLESKHCQQHPTLPSAISQTGNASFKMNESCSAAGALCWC